MKLILERELEVEVGFWAPQNGLLYWPAFLKQGLRRSPDSVFKF